MWIRVYVQQDWRLHMIFHVQGQLHYPVFFADSNLCVVTPPD